MMRQIRREDSWSPPPSLLWWRVLLRWWRRRGPIPNRLLPVPLHLLRRRHAPDRWRGRRHLVRSRGRVDLCDNLWRLRHGVSVSELIGKTRVDRLNSSRCAVTWPADNGARLLLLRRRRLRIVLRGGESRVWLLLLGRRRGRLLVHLLGLLHGRRRPLRHGRRLRGVRRR